ncbi:MAG: CapA family protein [Vicinamibacterales bacterium]
MHRRAFLKTSTGLAAASAMLGARPAASQAKTELVLVLTGDVILSRRVSQLTDERFLDVARWLQTADCTFGNCEMVIAAPDEGLPSAAGASLSVVNRPYIADELRWLGYDVMGTSNNHSLDYGHGGVRATLAHLERRAIAGAGTGANLQEAAAPRYCDTPSGRVALIGCSSTNAPHAPAVYARGDYPGVPGVNAIRPVRRYVLPQRLFDSVREAGAALATPLVQPPAQPSPTSTTFMGNTFVSGTTADLQSSPHPDDLERMTKHVAVARRNARLVLVSIHAHEIHRALDNPEPFVPTLAKACIDAGADVFITHGTHLVAGIEIYKGKPIFYGLGDFVFQFETVPGYAADVYQAYGLDPQALDPMEASAHVPLRGGRGLWETVVPRLRYDGERLLSVDVHPVTLGMDLPRAERGTPIAARPDDAERIVAGLAALSKGFGTEVRWTGAVGTVHL